MKKLIASIFFITFMVLSFSTFNTNTADAYIPGAGSIINDEDVYWTLHVSGVSYGKYTGAQPINIARNYSISVEFDTPKDIEAYHLQLFSGTVILNFYDINDELIFNYNLFSPIDSKIPINSLTGVKKVVIVANGQGGTIGAVQLYQMTDPPTIPTGLTAIGGNKTITLNWEPSIAFEATIAGYTIFRDGLIYANTTFTTYSDTEILSDEESHTYSIRAYDTNNKNSEFTSTVTATSIPSVPNVVLNSSSITGNSVNLDWIESRSDQGNVYKIYKDEVLIANTNNLTYQVNGLNTLTSYVFKVVGTDLYNRTFESNTVTIVTLQPLPNKPIFIESDITSDSFKINWGSVLYADTYNIYLDGIFVTNTIEKEYSFSDLNPKTSYIVTLESENEMGRTANSKAVYTLSLPVPTVYSASVAKIPNDPFKRILTYSASPDVSAVKVYMDGVLLGEYFSTQSEIELDYTALTAMTASIKVEPVEQDGKSYEFVTLAKSTGYPEMDYLVEKFFNIFQVLKNSMNYLVTGAYLLTCFVMAYFFFARKTKKMVNEKIPTKPTPYTNKDGFRIKEFKNKDVGGLFTTKMVQDHTFEKNGIDYKYKRVKGKGMLYQPKTFNDKIKHVKLRVNQVTNAFTGKKPSSTSVTQHTASKIQSGGKARTRSSGSRTNSVSSRTSSKPRSGNSGATRSK